MEAEISYLSPSEIAQSIKTTQLELAYERALREAERIYEEEQGRALRVQLLLLQHENDDLQQHIEEEEEEHQHMEDTNEELRAQLAEAEAGLQQTQMDLKARTRDLEHLKTEVVALNATSTDATRLLAEKLALARELNTIKPELEHLRSQSFISQKLLSEKLALQREVSALQVELETEKRAVQRIKAREESNSREDTTLIAEIEGLRKELTKAQRDVSKYSAAQEGTMAEMESLRKELAGAQRDAAKHAVRDDTASTAVESLRKDLAKAQRDAQKTERESRKKIAEWESEKEVLEAKLDAFRNKLRSTKEQLLEAQEEIERLQAAKMAQSAELTKARMTGQAAASNSRKRNVARFDPDMTIGTPGNGGPAAKKPRISVNVGDKSTFSITPFLNRTLSILPESPDDEDEPQDMAQKPSSQQVDGEGGVRNQASKSKGTKEKLDKAAATRKPPVPSTKTRARRALNETTNAKANTTTQKPQLAKLVEEDADMESDEGGMNPEENTDKENNEDNSATPRDSTEPSKKPRPLVQRKNIFDEPDMAPAPKIRSLGGGAGLGRINLKAKPVGRGKTLAEFSPLKRDRRATSILE
ncbi:putative -like methyltransferase protein [Cladophialophora carrionii]|uniref:Putative-like methyltransferase protein n=1 Tax=Cladophialophora carrionii TaxID=86049 RepID=A0A1C1CCT9_9EURO|nr:putative -like methyltransferase protein [Cladophialophora carrionii]